MSRSANVVNRDSTGQGSVDPTFSSRGPRNIVSSLFVHKLNFTVDFSCRKLSFISYIPSVVQSKN